MLTAGTHVLICHNEDTYVVHCQTLAVKGKIYPSSLQHCNKLGSAFCIVEEDVPSSVRREIEGKVAQVAYARA